MREYSLSRPGSHGVVADDGTVLAELKRLASGTYTLHVDFDDEDDGPRAKAHETRSPREYTVTRPGGYGFVADDGTVLAELQSLARGAYTLHVDSFDE